MAVDLKQLAAEVSNTIKAWVGDRLKAIEAGLPELVRKHVAELPKPKDGKDCDLQAMAAEIARQVALLPKPADGKSVSEEAVALMVKTEVSKVPPAQKGADADPRLVETLVNATVAAAMARIRQPEDGKGIDATEVRGMVSAAVAAQVALLPRPADGKDADPAAIERAVKAAVAALPTPDVAPLVRAEVQRAVADMPRPRDGEPGRDYDETVLKAAVALEVRAAVDALPPPPPGKDVDPEVVRATIALQVREAMSTLPVPQNGKDADQAAIVTQVFDLVMRAMPKPQDGKSVTIEEIKPLLEGEVMAWELEFERRGVAMLERLAERYKGKDGADGFTVDDLGLELAQDGRTVVVSLKSAGGRVLRKELVLAGMTQDRDVFRSGEDYKRGDCVTYGGSYWCAKCDTNEPPKGPSNAWRLVMKGAK